MSDPQSEGDVQIAPELKALFENMNRAKASDLHLKAGLPPHLRIQGEVHPMAAEPVTSEQIEHMAVSLMDARQTEMFATTGNVDVAYELPHGDRFRANVFRQRGTAAMAVRRVSRNIPDIESLHLPASIHAISQSAQGLILLAGPTGSGKSTTIASMIEHINKTKACHILTLEDPIEYLYESKLALVSQREIGIDVADFAMGLKYMTREDPDVVLIGEMRDHETFQAALQASETGHLVFGTIHASTAYQTIGRVLDLFPSDQRDRVRQSLSFNLRAIICQKLLPSIKPGIPRIPAVEVMISNPSVRQMIAEGRDADLLEVIVSHEVDGMQTFTKSLLDLIEGELIDPKVAYENASNVDELKMRLRGISSSRAGLRGR
ncbi:MAG: PilT/PilU family type 4a pilus ATPase [Planctomycetota bacterium]|nr:PilT/PilU family type 4a pilus ATPase [Planctomycetota bacterium]